MKSSERITEKTRHIPHTMATKTRSIDQPGTDQPQQVPPIQGESFPVSSDRTSSVNAAAALTALNPGRFVQVNNPAVLQSMRINPPCVPGAMKVSGDPTPSITNSSVTFGGDSATTVAAVKELTEVANYKDYSRVPMEQLDSDAVCNNNNATDKDPSFPVKLHQIISTREHEEFITWLPHGRSWRVVNVKALESQVIPLYFRHAKYASFMRQVNGWGFKRIPHGPDQNSYYHEVRGF
jgi:hypothetical protein